MSSARFEGKAVQSRNSQGPRTGPDPRKRERTGQQRPRLRSYLPPADSPVSQIEPRSLRRRSLPPPPARRPGPAWLNPTNHGPQPTASPSSPVPAARPSLSASASVSASACGPEIRPRSRPGVIWEMEFTSQGGAPGGHVIKLTNWHASYCGTAPGCWPMRGRLHFPPDLGQGQSWRHP